MWRIKGITLVGGRPIGIAHVPLSPGLNLVYGRNGVGKTKLLRAISDFMEVEFETRPNGYPARVAGQRRPEGWSRTSTDLCTYAFYREGGLHIDAPFALLESDDEFFRILARSAGLEQEMRDRIFGRDQEIDSRRTQWYEENSSPAGIVYARDDEPDWDSEFETAEDEEWRRLDRSVVRDLLASHVKDGASSESLSIDDCRALVDSGQWMISRSGALFACASLALDSAVDWYESVGLWSDVIAERSGRSSSQPKWGLDADREFEVLPGLPLAELGNLGVGVRGSLPPHPEHFGLESTDWLSMPIAAVPVGKSREEQLKDSLDSRDGGGNARKNLLLSSLARVAVEPVSLDEAEDALGIQSMTREWLAGRAGMLRQLESRQIEMRTGEWTDPAPTQFVSQRGGFSSYLTAALDEISTAATATFRTFFEDAPMLRVELSTVDEWFPDGPRVRWMAHGNDTPAFPIDDLGSAHRRFAYFSIRAALKTVSVMKRHSTKRSVSLALVDEPERALHRAGESRVVAALPGLADYVIAATHSPRFIAASSVNLIHLTKQPDERLRVASHLGGLTTGDSNDRRATADHLGVDLADLLLLTKVIILVEGPHDEMIIKFMCPEIIGHVDIAIVPLGGIDGIPGLANSRFLIDMTDARILVVTDNVKEPAIRKAESKAREFKAKGLRWDGNLRAQERGSSVEERKLIELLRRALAADMESRFTLFGFDEPDIVKFLPVELISPRHSAWRDADAAFLKSVDRKKFESGDGKRFKDWINHQKDSTGRAGCYHLEGIERALQSLESQWEESGGIVANRHVQFTNLVELVQRLR